MTTTTSPGANARLLPTLRSALGRALQWRLWLLFVAASLLCALVAGLPAFNWLSGVLDHSVHAGAIAAGEAPDAPEPLAAFALAARRARAKSEEAVLIAAKAQSLDDGRLGLDYLRTTHPDRYADRRGKGVEVNVATVQQTFDPAAVVRNLKNFARREGLIVEADSDG